MRANFLQSETAASVLDQAAVSGGNFLTTLVLARSLAPAEYGVFSLLFLALFAINTCHSSLIVYPLTLRGASSSPLELSRLTCVSLVHTALLAVPLALVLGVVTLVLHRFSLFPIMALAMLGWQLQETTRRALLSVLRFRSAILPDLLCYVGQGCIIAIVRPHSLFVVFLIIAITSFAATAWQFFLAVSWRASRGTGMRAFTTSHGIYAWEMGRYVLAGNALNMITLQIPSWTLALALAPVAVAGYQSLLNLVGIANPIIFSINSMLIPAIAREASHGYKRARQTALHYGSRFGILLLPAFLALFCAPNTIMSLVYGKSSPYLYLAPLLRVFVTAFVLQYLATVVGAYEGGMSRPKTYMWVQLMGTGLLLTAGVFIIYRFGIAGAVYAMLLASAARLLTFLFLSHFADKGSGNAVALADPVMETSL